MRITIRRSNHRHLRFYSLLLLLMTLIMARYSLQILIPRIVFLGMILLIALTGDRDEIIAMCMCCIPLHESIDFFFAIVICVSCYVFKYSWDVRLNLSFVSIFLIVIWELLHCFNNQVEIVRLTAELIPFFVLLFFLSIDASKVDYDFVVRAFSFTTLLAGLTMLIREIYVADFNLLSAVAGIQRLGVADDNRTIHAGAIHPNSLGILCVVASAGLMQLRSAERGRKQDVLICVCLIVLGALTASRTFLACLVFMFALLVFAQKANIKKRMRLIGSAALVLMISLLLLFLVFPDLLEYFYKRFLVADITTGRLGLMRQYHEFIISDPGVLFFGIGLHDLGEKVTVIHRIANVTPHNGIQECVLAWGLVGLPLMCGLFWCVIRKSRCVFSYQGLLNYIPLLILLFKSLAGQMISSSYTMLALSFAYLSLCANLRTDRELREAGSKRE